MLIKFNGIIMGDEGVFQVNIYKVFVNKMLWKYEWSWVKIEF